MTNYLPVRTGLFGLLLSIAVLVLFMGHDASAQQLQFFAPCSTYSVEEPAANAASRLTGTFGIGLDAACAPFADPSQPSNTPGQYNSGGLIYFTPPEWEVARDEDIPDGTQIGQFKTKATLGLLSNPCNNVLPVDFILYEGTTDRSNTISPLAPGEPDRLSPLADTNGDGVPEGALQWPTYLEELENVDLSKVISRYIGVNDTVIAGLTIVLNFLLLEPGAKVSDLFDLDPRLGYPAVTVLQDPSALASDSDPINDFCTPLFTEQILNGNVVGGGVFRSNPGDGVYNFVTFTASIPDEDLDGIENSLDPCPNTPNESGWDPRGSAVQNPGDIDGDGIPDDCDPFPEVPSIFVSGMGLAHTDEDGDGWANRADNCPLVANPDQADSDGDVLGDVCDPHPDELGFFQTTCVFAQVTVGAGGDAPVDPQTLSPCDPNAQVSSGTNGDGGGGTGSQR